MKKPSFTLLSLHFSLSPSFCTLLSLSLSPLLWVTLRSRFCLEYFSRDGITNRTKQIYCEVDKNKGVYENKMLKMRAVELCNVLFIEIVTSSNQTLLVPNDTHLTNDNQAYENTHGKHFD